MKKTLLITIGSLFAIFFIMGLLPTFNQVYFYIKHISLYLFLAILLITLLMQFYKKIIIKSNIDGSKVKALQLFTIIFLGTSLYLISEAQLKYIGMYETPYLLSCTYYDEYDNLLYSSQFFGKCPNLDNVITTDDSISFSVVETSSRLNSDYYRNNEYIEEQYLNIYRFTEISISYTSNKLLSTISILSSTSIKSDTLGEFQNKYYSLRKDITNTYSINSFESTYDYYFIDLDNYNLLSIEEVEHYPFTEDERERKVVTSNITYEPNNIGYIVLSKFEDNESKTFGTGTLVNVSIEEYNKVINLTVEDGSVWDFVGHEYTTYVAEDKIFLHNNFFDNNQQWVEYEYERLYEDHLVQTENHQNGFSSYLEDIYEIYNGNDDETLYIEDKSSLIKIVPFEHGYLAKEYVVSSFYYNLDDNEIGSLQYDWYYWNSIGYSLIDLYDYEHEIFRRTPSQYPFFIHNPLISTYYD